MEKRDAVQKNRLEHDASLEISIDKLPERLGFLETEELKEIKRLLIRAMQADDAEAVTVLIDRYYFSGEPIVNEYDGEDYGRAQIGLSLALALARRDAGRIEDYVADLDEGLMYASAEGYTDVLLLLQQAKNDIDI